eukprot:6768622-Pyramimonas_sp.AAC.1
MRRPSGLLCVHRWQDLRVAGMATKAPRRSVRRAAHDWSPPNPARCPPAVVQVRYQNPGR